MVNARNSYVNKCKDFVSHFTANNSTLIHYVRNKKGQKIGVIVAARTELYDYPVVGWSLCNIKKERFNKYIGLQKALSRAVDKNDGATLEDFGVKHTLPQATLKHFGDFRVRAERYFYKVEDPSKAEKITK